MSYNRFQSKICKKVPSQHFLAIFRPKIGQNIGKFTYFHKIANISKTRQIVFLELRNSFKPQIWTRGTSCEFLGSYRGIFENFDFSPLFYCRNLHFSIKIAKNEGFCSKKEGKNKKFQKSLCTILAIHMKYLWSKFEVKRSFAAQ